MKKHIKLLLVGLSTLVLNVGCTSISDITNVIGINTNSSTSETTKSTSSESTVKYAGQEITLKMLNEATSVTTLPSTGESKLLVIPVYFSDYSPTKMGLEESEIETNIYNAFFGNSEDTGWESVSSYYTKSSYNKLNITGEVSPLVNLNMTLSEGAALTSSTSSSYEPTYTFLEEAVNWVKNNTDIDVTQYDTDKDGYIDGVWLVYLNPYLSSTTNLDYYIESEGWSKTSLGNSRSNDYIDYSNISNISWAYTYWDYSTTASVSSPNPKAYCWASYSFLKEGGYDKVDAHTYIHETGHLMGLEDYYSYDYSDAPIGGLDMMDNNIGDHNAYSKYLLDWITPTLVSEKGTYTLSKFTETGDALIIPASYSTWNNSSYNEYLIIEFYTPDGLNQLDAENPYASGAQMFTQPGILIYHVDSRMVKVTESTAPIRGPRGGTQTYYSYTYVNSYSSPTSTSYTTVAASNTASYSNSNGRLINLISSSYPTGTITTTSYSPFPMGGIYTSTSSYYYQDRDSYRADDSDMFVVGDSITSFNFNNGKSLSYDISITSIDETSATITLS